VHYDRQPPMRFPRFLLLLAVWLSCGRPLFAQHPAKFHWDPDRIEKDDWESLAQSKSLPANEREGLIRALAGQFRPSMRDLKVESERELVEFAGRTYVKPVDLSGNGRRDFLARAADRSGFLCSPTGNCEAWIFRRQGDRYSAILKRGAVQTFTIQPTFTNGFHDIVLGQHASATEQGLTLFRFDGQAYRLAGCYVADWETLDQDGKMHELEQPRIKPCTHRSGTPTGNPRR